ncbi:hypothetical protein C8J57DRAFT_1212072 [Mycena rebaudengoi]|nr:hypothetical protein C8J57DRAFT_1212072 [Mycena rebaudengoi]
MGSLEVALELRIEDIQVSLTPLEDRYPIGNYQENINPNWEDMAHGYVPVTLVFQIGRPSLPSTNLLKEWLDFMPGITRTVAYRVIGPGLRQAIRLIRYPDAPRPVSEDAVAMAGACPEDAEIGFITVSEQKALVKNSETACKLEKIYSIRLKDNSSKDSSLDEEESCRFQRSLYRFWLFCHLFPGSGDTLSQDALARLGRQRAEVLRVLPHAELRQLCSVVSFLRGILAELTEAEENRSDQPSLRTG